jgi:hypothetical protein
MTDKDARETVVEFYWLPGRPYCAALRGPLRRSGLPLREVNIWEIAVMTSARPPCLGGHIVCGAGCVDAAAGRGGVREDAARIR